MSGTVIVTQKWMDDVRSLLGDAYATLGMVIADPTDDETQRHVREMFAQIDKFLNSDTEDN